MIDSDTIHEVIGKAVHGSDGNKLGTVGQVFLDDTSGAPEWVTVQTGLFGTKESFVPIADATLSADGLSVPFDKDQVKGAPRVDAEEGHLDPEEETELYRHYGMSEGGTQQSGRVDGVDATRDEEVYDQAAVAGGKPAGTDLDRDDASMTRSEERLNVGTEKVETGRARLRKYVVTENQTVTVPVTREEVRMVSEPITQEERSAYAKGDGAGLSEEQSDVVLTEERVVVSRETVPVEKVSLAKESVTEQKQVTEQVGKERIETEGDVRREGDSA